MGFVGSPTCGRVLGVAMVDVFSFSPSKNQSLEKISDSVGQGERMPFGKLGWSTRDSAQLPSSSRSSWVGYSSVLAR